MIFLQGKEILILQTFCRINFLSVLANPLMCPLCKKLLRTQQAMDRHVTICPRRRTHACQICTHTFTTKSDLKRHHMVHEKPSEKKYKVLKTVWHSRYYDQFYFITQGKPIKMYMFILENFLIKKLLTHSMPLVSFYTP